MPVIEKPVTFLPYGRQTIDQADVDAVVEVLKSDYLTTGPVISTFENTLGDRFGSKVVAVSNGTTALYLAYRALGIGPGDYVIVPATTYLATANAVLLCGADVIFADVDPDNGLMGVQQLSDTLAGAKNKNVRAVVPVHLGGQTEQMSEIYRVAKAHDLLVIDDACHALGTRYVEGDFNYPVGSCQHSDATIFSFHPLKTLAMGEGGAIATRHDLVYRKLGQLRSHGVVRDARQFVYPERAAPWYYEMQDISLNYRITDIQCALGLSQLKKIDQFCGRRRALVDHYNRLLTPLSPVIKPVLKLGFSHPCWHLYSVLIDYKQLSFNRSELMNVLRAQGIGTQVLYIPVNEQPFYENRYGVSELSGAKRYYQRTLSLPLYPTLTDKDIEYVVDTLRNLL